MFRVISAMRGGRGIALESKWAWRRGSSAASGAPRPGRCPCCRPRANSRARAAPVALVGSSSSRSRTASPSRPVRAGTRWGETVA